MAAMPVVRTIAAMLVILPLAVLAAAPVSDVAATRHNLSSSSTGTVSTTDSDQICVFCHTPHGASNITGAPLWNRQLSDTATYTLYTSDSLDATLEQPGGSSKLCLSCHDGAMAIGKVNVLNAATDVTLTMTGTDPDGSMPAGSGAQTGFTRDLGVDLSNDHPISFTYDDSLALTDGELHAPSSSPHIANRIPGTAPPAIPLENDQLQCISCHDPHIKDSLGSDIKFLRMNRFQEVASPTDGTFNSDQDIICLGCHDKAGWSQSAHANSHIDVANETYTATAAAQRDFSPGIAVWQAACLNCHDSHTVQGARRLLREGTDSTSTPKSGGNPALEETCYQCHDVLGGINNILGAGNNKAPDIKSDFTTTAYHMPIADSEQAAGSEVHSISDNNFTESPVLLGKGEPGNRHAECTDCHNPHRVIKNRLFNANPAVPDAAATHDHNPVAGSHTNIASGSLAGSTGVEPIYGSSAWNALPIGYEVKSGYAGPGAGTVVGSSYVTREYQICLKCHSDNAWTTPPTIGPSIGINGVDQYTNQAMEFQAPLGDKGEPGGNHRSWHPVIDNTARTAAVRGNMDPNNFLAPWNDNTGANIGNQTMYCSDCHGSDTGVGSGTVVPVGGEDGAPWGPHGSSNAFILKGAWDTAAAPPAGNEICFKCHDKNNYSPTTVGAFPKSGFSTPVALGGGMGAGVCNMPAGSETNLHIGHKALVGELRCTWCHTAVPHGWRNKALLVDITNDPLAETGNNCNGVEPCTVGPYYQNAYLGGNAGGINWATSGNWVDTDCGGGGAGGGWMNNTCNAPQ